MAASNTVVNTNIMALNTHRSLKNVGNTQAKASERLSSGLRINSAADDAAGLAISEKMRAQIRGLDMASKNSQDAISLIQTAEGGMQEIDNMLQRIRELVVQAANDTNEYTESSTTADLGDRQKIQDEINSLVKEIDSMSERVEFNKKKLIDGTYSVSDITRTATVADQASIDAAQAILDAATQALTDYMDANDIDDLNQDVTDAEDALAANAYFGDYTAADAALTAALKAVEDIPDILLVSDAMTALTDLIATFDAMIAGVGAEFTAAGGTAAGGTLSTSTIIDATNLGLISTALTTALKQGAVDALQASLEAAVTALVSTNFFGLNLTDADGSSLDISSTPTTGGLDWTAIEAQFDALVASDYWKDTFSNLKTALDAPTFFPEHGNLAAAQQAYDDIAKLVQTELTAITDAEGAVEAYNTDVAGYQEAIDLAQAGLDAASLLTVEEDVTVGGNGLYFQVGANANQGWVMNIGSVKSDTLGIGYGNGNTNIDILKETGEGYITGLLNDLDDALTYVTSERSKLGAAQNRLEYTIKSLDISSENLSSAESRIRDTDMAKEMMNYTQANVLQQAAISMLAQANQAPQNLLTLLR